MPSRKARTKTESDAWISRIRESSHDVVLAGLASLTRANGADGDRAQADFSTLVAEGRKLEPELHEMARKVWSDWIGTPRRMIGLQSQGRLQGVFDERVMAVLIRMGVPTGEDMAELRDKVDRLLERTAPQPPAAGTRPASRKQAGRRRSTRG